MVALYRKYLVVSLVIVVFGIILFLIWYQNKRNSYDIQVHFDSSNSLYIINKLPTSDLIGKTFNGEGTEDGVQGYIEFSVYNPASVNIRYEIYVTEKSLHSLPKIKGNYVKFYLTDENDNPLNGFDTRKLPTFSDLNVLKDKPGSKLLYKGFLHSDETQQLKLRVWLSDSYSMSASTGEKAFSCEIQVRNWEGI